MKYLITLILFFGLLGCEKNNEIYSCKGIPDENQAFSFMYFKTESEGYLFGTLTHYQEMSVKDLNDPNFSPQSRDEANIYKTLDGGNSWVKINSISNFSYFDIATYFNEGVYILRDNRSAYFKSSIVKFDLSSGKLKTYDIAKPISSLWHNDRNLNFTNNRQNIKLYKLDTMLILKDSISIENYVTDGLSMQSVDYGIFSDKGRAYFGSIDSISSEIRLSILPEKVVKKDENNILVAGNNKKDDNEIDLVSYNVNTKKTTVIKEFKGYSIVQGLQSNDKVIAGFIGNISGMFTKYDLFYSLDHGQTWNIKKLEEKSYIRPSCLINNTMFIYSGGARMQKIILKNDI
jgi:hypothetical protein